MAGRSAAARGQIGSALQVALGAAKHERRDGAAVALAVRLARDVDAAQDTKTVGDLAPKLLAVLAALGMTPAARTKVWDGGVADVPNAEPAAAAGPVSDSPAARIDEFRARARTRRAPAVDAAAAGPDA
jgi:hypothetical protein